MLVIVLLFPKEIGTVCAAGKIINGFHAAGYISGTFVGMALIFGRSLADLLR